MDQVKIRGETSEDCGMTSWTCLQLLLIHLHLLQLVPYSLGIPAPVVPL